MLHIKWYNLHYMISKYEPSWAILQTFQSGSQENELTLSLIFCMKKRIGYW